MSVADTGRFSIFDQRGFAFFWFARGISQVALQMQTVAVGWQVYDITRNPFDLGLVGLAQFVATLIFALIAGHAADRYDRRVVLRCAQAVASVAMALLLWGTLAGWLTLHAIIAIVFLIGAARSFEQPTAQSLMPSLVPAPALSRAIAASASVGQIATIGGPALGGLLYVLWPAGVYAVCTVLYATAFVLVSLIAITRPAARREPLSLRGIFVGIHFIRRNPLILGSITLDLFAVLLGGATALLPVFARDILNTGPTGLGLLRLAPAIGAFAMSLLLARAPIRRRAGPLMFAAVAIFGLATIVFALSTSLILSGVALIVLGAADLLSVVVRSTLIQVATPDEVRGRVSSVNSLFVGTSNQLGEFESGSTAALLGTVPATVLGGIGTLLVVAAAWKLFPELAAADTLDRPKT